MKCSACNRKVDHIIWSMCQSPGHCYHCGAELPSATLTALAEALKRKPRPPSRFFVPAPHLR